MSRNKVITILVVCLAAIVGLYCYIQITEARNKHFQVTFFNVGQGDAALIRFADGRKMLVDCGPDRSILPKLGGALPFYDRALDFLLVTHFDLDHYGGCLDVLKRYRVGEIISNGERKGSDPYWPAWEERTRQYPALNTKIVQWQRRDIAGARLEFLAPDESLGLESKYDRDNNRSIVFRLANDGKTFLFVGDMEVPLENVLLAKYCSSTPVDCPSLRADYLKVGHHGSDSSSDERFLEAVGPKTTVVSVGRNSFGHPSFRVLRKLERAGAEIWRTDEKGDIIVE